MASFADGILSAENNLKYALKLPSPEVAAAK